VDPRSDRETEEAVIEVLWLAAAGVGGALVVAMLGVLVSLVRERSDRWKS
jgi:hypothetical protein